MDIEFLDPGPDQPEDQPEDRPVHPPGHPGADPGRPAMEPGPGRLDRESVGVLVMLAAAAILPVVAAYEPVYSVRTERIDGVFVYAVDAWGRYAVAGTPGDAIATHGPRFGVVLALCGVGFAALALALIARLTVRRTPLTRAAGSAVTALTGALGGVLTGLTAAMALEIESVFDNLRSSNSRSFDSVREIRLQIGGAVWLSLAALLAAGLATAAALRLRRTRPEVRPGEQHGAAVTPSLRGY